MIETRKSPREIVRSKGLTQISDKGDIEAVIRRVLESNSKSVNDYRSGKKNAFTYLVGQVMKETRGRANPRSVNELLSKALGE